MLDFVLRAWNSVIGGVQNVNATGNALHTIDEEDAAIHQGEGWSLGKKFSIPPGAASIFAGVVGPTGRVHFQDFSISATTGPIDIAYYKGSAISSGSGTEEFAINRRLDITSNSEMRIFSGVTLTTTGTLVVPTVNLASPALGGRTNPSGAGFFHGYVMDYGQTYAIGMTNTSVDSATLWVNFIFHEPAYL